MTRICYQEADGSCRAAGKRVCAEGDTCAGNTLFHVPSPEAGSKGIQVYYSVVLTRQRKHINLGITTTSGLPRCRQREII